MPVIQQQYPESYTVDAGNTGMGAASQDLNQRFYQYMKERITTEFGRKKDVIEKAEKKISDLARYHQNWDSYGAPAPSVVSIRNARRVLVLIDLADMAPTRVLPSAEGGIGICFVKGERYADIECSNEGEILGVYYAGKEMPRLLETDSTDKSVKAALRQIHDHFLI